MPFFKKWWANRTLPELHSPYDRPIVRLAVPALGTLLAEPLYVIADTAIVGRLGTDQLAGLALASTVLLTIHGLLIFLAYGTTAAVSRSLGAKQHLQAAHTAVQALWLAIGLGVMSAAAVALTADPLLRALGASDTVLEAGHRYLLISAPGIPFILVMLAASGTFSGRQDTKTPLILTSTGAVLNLVIELVLIYGLGHGIGASAVSSVIAQAVTGSCLVWLSLRWARPLITSLKPDLSMIGSLAIDGAGLLVRTAALRATLVVSTALAARLGVAQVAAHQIALQIWFTSALALDAVAIAGQALTGQHLGAQRFVQARAAAHRMIQIDAVLGLIMAVGIFAARAPIAQLFTTDVDVIALTTSVLVFVAVAQPINSYVFALDGVLIGAGDNHYLGKTMVYSFGIFLLGTALATGTSSGLAGLWLAAIAFMVARSWWLHQRFGSDKWLK